MVNKKQIKILREITGAGVLDCKNVIQKVNSNFNNAIDLLKKNKIEIAKKKLNNQLNEGIISSYVHHRSNVGVMIEIGCQTDFVARNKNFQEFSYNLATQIALSTSIKYISLIEIPKIIFLIENKTDLINSSNIEISINKFNKILNKLNYNILLKQPYLNDEAFSVENFLYNNISSFGENIKIKKFVKYMVE